MSITLRHWWPLGLVLLVAVLLRVALWNRVPRQGLISDEGEYLAAAVWLAQGREFTWHLGWLWTRAPLYPLFLAVHIRLFGITLTPIYLTQNLLSLVQVVLVYALAAVATPRLPARAARVAPALAALLMGLYFPLAVYTQVLLSETLYTTLILAALLAFALWAQRLSTSRGWRAYWLLVVGGALLGLAVLTRGLALGFVPLVAGWAAVVMLAKQGDGPSKVRWRNALLATSCCLVAALAPVLPWSLYATRLYGGFVAVDTTGAYNLLLGARTAYDGNRKDAATRTFVLALLDASMSAKDRKTYLAQSCLSQHNDVRIRTALSQPVTAIPQAQRQQLMTAEGLCLLRERPLAFVQKSLGEFIDFFRINYGGDERFTDGFTTGRMSPFYTLGLFLLDDTLYVLALPLAVIGWALARMNDQRSQTVDRSSQPQEASRTSPISHLPSPISHLATLVALWWLYNLLAAPLLFAINRFRVPLVPFVLIYAAYALALLPAGGWRQLHKRVLPHLALAATLLFVVVAPASWISAYDPTAQAYVAQESYLGPHPSSVYDTYLALKSRPQYARVQALGAALGAGDSARARALLTASDIPSPTLMLSRALVAGLDNHPADGLALLPSPTVVVSDALWTAYQRSSGASNLWRVQASVVQGDLLRRMQKFPEAKAAFTPLFVDNVNPVDWSWNWLHPPPLPDNRIDMGGNLDLGYIQGFYLGEGITATRTTWRWSSGMARLRFPGAGTGKPQTLQLRIDGASIALPQPRVTVLVNGEVVATQALDASVRTYDVSLPAAPQGSDVLITLQAPVFVPPANDFLAQQGAQVGQLRLLGLRIDWMELR